MRKATNCHLSLLSSDNHEELLFHGVENRVPLCFQRCVVLSVSQQSVVKLSGNKKSTSELLSHLPYCGDNDKEDVSSMGSRAKIAIPVINPQLEDKYSRSTAY